MILHTNIRNDGILNFHDETSYLLSSPENVQRLEQARLEFEKGQWTEVKDLDELFK